MTSNSDAFQNAVQQHQAGHLEQAAHIYQQILGANPNHAHARHLLGVVALQTGQFESAIDLISAAIQIESREALFHCNLGEAYRASGKWAQAERCYQEAIRLDPRAAQPCFFLAAVQLAQGRATEAQQSCRQALALEPNHAEAHYFLGHLLEASGDVAGATASYTRALASRPDYYEPLFGLGQLLLAAGELTAARDHLRRAVELQPDRDEAWYCLGSVEGALKNWSAAIECCRAALRLNANLAAAESQLAIALQSEGLAEESLPHYQRSLELQPGQAIVHFNWATALVDQKRIREAVAQFEEVVRLDPTHPLARLKLGGYYQELGELDRAMAQYDKMLEIDPASARAHYNRALILLARGELESGWAAYLWRTKIPEFPINVMSEPQWDGSALPDQTLLLFAEQGLGDTLQFIRYIPLVKKRCPRVVVQVQPHVVKLLKQSGFDVVGDDVPLPPFDVQAPFLSLPGLMRTTLANVPADVPYLFADQALIDAWRTRLAKYQGRKIGIAWQGNPNNTLDAWRSIALAHFEPLAKVADVTLVSLQKHEGVSQLAEVPFAVEQLEGRWDEAAGPFMDTAAVMKNLDLVITADTATAHLAGGLGVPVWIAIAAKPDWRWALEREDTPWYPNVRLFRQRELGNWQEVFERMAAELR